MKKQNERYHIDSNRGLYTKWGEELRNKLLRDERPEEFIWQEYPRPHLRRNSYINLNGIWDYAFTNTADLPCEYEGDILVPFSPEAALSGVSRQLQPGNFLWYRRQVPVDWKLLQGASMASRRLLLHFGAVDERCKIYINGKQVGEHAIGYLAFTLDITDAVLEILRKENEDGSDHPVSFVTLEVCVQDDSDTSYHARGKQKLHRKGMYYTAQSGIWQTVWMEYVPENYVVDYWMEEEELYLDLQVSNTVPVNDHLSLTIDLFQPELFQTEAQQYLLEHVESEADASEAYGAPILHEKLLCGTHSKVKLSISIPEEYRKSWSPESPYLYPLCIRLGAVNGDAKEDVIWGYVADRRISLKIDASGETGADRYPHVYLNDSPIFQRGVLDQGYWPEGLYTAPSDEAFVYDIRAMQQMGFHMIRKHCKTEPERWYFHCDRLGMLVWQDMVNGGSSYKDWYVTYLATAFTALHIMPGDRNRKLLAREEEAGRKEFRTLMEGMVRQLRHHPGIVTWVLFNEGWGQFDTVKLTKYLRQLDGTRLIDSASGWFDQGVGDFNSIHNYFFKMKARSDGRRAFILSEYGGYTHGVKGHIWSRKSYGYGAAATPEKLQAAYEKRKAEAEALIPQGLCATVYTQVSDIEEEINGVLTYDRKVCKLQG